MGAGTRSPAGDGPRADHGSLRTIEMFEQSHDPIDIPIEPPPIRSVATEIEL